MSYKIKDFTPLLEDENLKLVDFSSSEGEITNIYVQKYNEKLVKNLLRGKIKNKSGRYQIDGVDVINNSFVKRHIEYIKTGNWFQRFLPTRSILVLSLFFDLHFLKKARINYAEHKFEYLSFVDSKNDLTDLKVRNEINTGIEKFLKFTIDNHNKINKNTVKQIKELNKKNSETLFKDFSPQVKVLSRAIFDAEADLKLNRNLLKFYQVLFDKIQSMDDLRDSCPCEYNARRSNNKLLKKQTKVFKFRQTKYIVAKQCKFLSININELRLKNIKLLFNKNQFKKQLKFELKKYYKDKESNKEFIQKVNEELASWQLIIDDIYTEHDSTEQVFLFDFLKKETNLLREFIVSKIHDEYHKLIFGAEIEYGNRNEFIALKKHYKKKMISVFSQGVNAITSNVKKLDLNFEWFLKSSFKLSSLNIIYSKMLKAINMGKKNIVFSDFLHLLTSRDLKALMASIDKINEFYPDVSFIILHSKLKSISDLNPHKSIYTVANKHLQIIDFLNLFKVKYKDIFNEDLFASNKLSFQQESTELIKTEKRLWNINVDNSIKEGFIFINPLNVSTKFIEDKALPLSVRLVKNNRFSDPNIYCGLSQEKTRIFFYSAENDYKKDDNVTIYLEHKSVIKIAKKEI